ncbi:uncharacterized protein LOC135075485 [Ostrinia nubilalis]|uniref:uncharacterized protein LOC135075485 n=1 Tax=Ostrinia nubilalis TaxID=29057 RepID=UPI00308269FF
MMGGNSVIKQQALEDILTEKQLHQIVKEYEGEEPWQLTDYSIKPATEGLAGFLGVHLKIRLNVKLEGRTKTIHLFAKCMPFDNKPKIDFIDRNNFYRREMIMFQLIEKMRASEGPNPWCTRALVCNESILVLPDLHVQGYATRPHNRTLDLPHVLVAAASLARCHAAVAKHEARFDKPHSFYREHESTLTEPNFVASPWLTAAAKLTTNILTAFSTKPLKDIPGLEDKIHHGFLAACDDLTLHEDTLNVVLHKDMWPNNIMFKYENGLPANALLIDFQCIRYGPPSFDLMAFLYLTTSRSFREQHERKILHYYYCVFYESLDDATKRKLNDLGFDREEFLRWCERSRRFGLCEAISIFPYVLMDPVVAQKTFDDPVTFDKYFVDDRSEPVLAHANEDPIYKNRQLEVAEEFVERFVLNQP